MNSCQYNSANGVNGTETLGSLPIAMAYVPWQRFHQTLELGRALKVGTIFPELHQPFCGRRGCM
ncbi:MAG: spore coat associated protein CotJA [Eubacteriales bacterium]|nr:spore coat associated protein CotJA [Eubacteriales bacterium]